MSQQIPFSLSFIKLGFSYLYPKYYNFYLTNKAETLSKPLNVS